MSVIDLGSFPGGWTQVVQENAGNKGTVVAVDIQNMKEIKGAFFIHKSITELEDNDFEEIREKVPFDLVLSDMAPNLSGVRVADQARSMELTELALDLATRILKPHGALVVKCFEGAGTDEFRDACRAAFRKVVNHKPDASRSSSREFYLIGLDYRG